MKSKGYAFVSFVKQAEAENAIQSMNGQWIGSKSIRTNWSTRKLMPPRENTKNGGIGSKNNNKQSYEEIYNQSSPTNTTVYCGGFLPNVINDELMHKHFQQFGPIQDVRVFKDKGYAFIKFVTKESATKAIEHTHNSEVNGYPVKCFWGRENGENNMNNIAAASAAGAIAGTIIGPNGLPTTPQQAAAVASLPTQMMAQQQLAAAAAAAASHYQYASAYQQMGYWYPPAVSLFF